MWRKLWKRLTRHRRYWRAVRRLDKMVDAVPADRRDMNETEHNEWVRIAARVNAHGRRLMSLGKRWGET